MHSLLSNRPPERRHLRPILPEQRPKQQSAVLQVRAGRVGPRVALLARSSSNHHRHYQSLAESTGLPVLPSSGTQGLPSIQAAEQRRTRPHTTIQIDLRRGMVVPTPRLAAAMRTGRRLLYRTSHRSSSKHSEVVHNSREATHAPPPNRPPRTLLLPPFKKALQGLLIPWTTS